MGDPGETYTHGHHDSVLRSHRWRTAENSAAYELPFDDGAFDFVHAHQLLQHLSDPVAALREMRRVCRPGGVVAARDADYAAMTWFPASEGIDRWSSLYRRLAR